MKVGSLFSGIGGFDLGFERAGMEIIWQCEIDKYCQSVLKKHWPNAQLIEDVRNVKKEEVAPVDLLCGGFPCQPHSLAGKRKGAADNRDLWPEFRRVISELRPTWITCENVPGIYGVFLDGVLSDLASLGYQSLIFEIPACAVDAPHKRSRVFIVAHSGSERRQQESRSPSSNEKEDAGGNQESNNILERNGEGNLAYSDNKRRQSERSLWIPNGKSEFGDDFDGRSQISNLGDSKGNTERTRFCSSGETVQDTQERRRRLDHASNKGQWSEYEWIVCGDGKRRRLKPGIRPVAYGVPGRMVKLKALGNSLVPQVAEIIGNYIMKVHYGTV